MVLLVGFIVWSFLSYGWTNIMVFGSMFQKWRDFCNRVSPNVLGKLFGCPMCLGAWVGFLLSSTFQRLGWHTPMEVYGVDIFYAAVFLDGILTSGVVWFIHNLEEAFERVGND